MAYPRTEGTPYGVRDCARHGQGVPCDSRGACRFCARENNKRQRDRHAEKRKESRRQWHAANREHHRDYCARYYAQNRAELMRGARDKKRWKAATEAGIRSPVLRGGFLLVTDDREPGEREWRAVRPGQRLGRGERIVADVLPGAAGWVVEPPVVGAERAGDERVRAAVGRFLARQESAGKDGQR
jgi:hypothetical protein